MTIQELQAKINAVPSEYISSGVLLLWIDLEPKTLCSKLDSSGAYSIIPKGRRIKLYLKTDIIKKIPDILSSQDFFQERQIIKGDCFSTPAMIAVRYKVPVGRAKKECEKLRKYPYKKGHVYLNSDVEEVFKSDREVLKHLFNMERASTDSIIMTKADLRILLEEASTKAANKVIEERR